MTFERAVSDRREGDEPNGEQSPLDRFRRERPLAFALAVNSSLATRIEPRLLRRLRLATLPGVDASAEADLWWSPIVQVRSPSAFLFHAEIAAELRATLASEPDRLCRAHEISAEVLARSHWTTRVEVELVWLGLRAGAAATADDEGVIQRHFRRLLAAFATDEEREVAAWAARSLPRLPRTISDRVESYAVALAASARLRGQRVLAGAPPPGVARHLWTDLLPKQMGEVPVEVERAGGYLIFRAGRQAPDGALLLRVPQTNPLLIEVGLDRDGTNAIVALDPAGSAAIPAPSREVWLRTLVGKRYRLRLASQPAEEKIDIDWGRVGAILRDACALMSVDNAPIVGTAYLVDPLLAVTAAHVVRAGHGFLRGAITLRFPSLRVQATLLRVDAESDVAVLRLTVPARDIIPLRLAAQIDVSGERWIAVAMASDRDPFGLSEIAVVAGARYQTASSEREPRLELFPAAVMAGFSGGPVWADGYVVGHVVSVSSGERCALAVTAARIREVLGARLGALHPAVASLSRFGQRVGVAYLIRSDIAVTCAHLIEGSGERVRLRFEGTSQEAEVVQIDRDHDCALLRLTEPITRVEPLDLILELPQGDAWIAAWPHLDGGAIGIEGTVSGSVKPAQAVLIQLETKLFPAFQTEGRDGAPVLVDGRTIGHLVKYVGPAPDNPDFLHVHACPGRAIMALLKRLDAGISAAGSEAISSAIPQRSISPEEDPRSIDDSSSNAGLDTYIERPVDAVLYRRLSDGRHCYVFGPRQSRKSELARRVMQRLRRERAVCATFDLSFVRADAGPDAWLDHLGQNISLELGLPAPARFSEEVARPRQGVDATALEWSQTIQRALAANSAKLVVLIFDELDSLEDPAIKDAFAAAVQSLLSLQGVPFCVCLVASAWAEDLLRGWTQFARQEIFADDYQLSSSEHALERMLVGSSDNVPAMIRRIFHWLSGHPLLTYRLCAELQDADEVRGPDAEAFVDSVVKRRFLDARGSVSTFSLVENRISSDPEVRALAHLYGRVYAGDSIAVNPADRLHRRLIEAGLVKIEAERLSVRNRLFATIFDQRWIDEHAEKDERPAGETRSARPEQVATDVLSDRPPAAPRSLSARSPFRTAGALPPGSPLFVGRDRELSYIENRLYDRSILIVGARRIGKTSLLNRVLFWARTRPDLDPIYIDCAGSPSLEGFAARLAMERGHHGAFSPEGLLPTIVSASVAASKLPVFLLNEIDSLLVHAPTLFAQIRALDENGRARFLMVGYTAALAACHDVRSPFFSFVSGLDFGFRALWLGELSEDAARRLIDVLEGDELGLRWNKDDKEPGSRLLLQASYRIPWLVQSLCHRVVERLDEDGRDVIFASDVESIVSTDGSAVESYFAHIPRGIVTALAPELSPYDPWKSIQLLLLAVARQRYFLAGPFTESRWIDYNTLDTVSPAGSDLGFTVVEAQRLAMEAIEDMLPAPDVRRVAELWRAVELHDAFRALTLSMMLQPDPDQGDRFGFFRHIYPQSLARLAGDTGDPTLDRMLVEKLVEVLAVGQGFP
jgi:S1-C subfamily serine protease